MQSICRSGSLCQVYHCTDKAGHLQSIVDACLPRNNKSIYLETFDSCCWGVKSSVPLFWVFPCTLLAMVWNISQILANEVDTADKSRFDLRAERGLTETLTSSWSVLHVDVQKNSVVVCPNVTLSPACKTVLLCCGQAKPFKMFRTVIISRY